jgi:precorrin-6B methylase 2
LNGRILDSDVQQYLTDHAKDDVHRIAMGKSPFAGVEARELANQIAAKSKSAKKLPTWYNKQSIYYPPLLSIEQCSSESTAAYKAKLVKGNSLIDLTGGFGVDSYYFAQVVDHAVHCELNPELSRIAAHNAAVLGYDNLDFVAGDGIEYLKTTDQVFDTIYVDPARRSTAGKVFMLKDCSPNVVEIMDLLLEKSQRIIIKTAPLLDISAGLKELKQVSEIHIISVKNECKELLWVLDRNPVVATQIVAVTLNDTEKEFRFDKGTEEQTSARITEDTPGNYLYEPDAALLKSGAFNLIAQTYDLEKLHHQTQLYISKTLNTSFPGRIFKINKIINTAELKKEKELQANVIVRNYRDKAENLVKKYKIKPDHHRFLLFTESKKDGYIVIDATIEQHY